MLRKELGIHKYQDLVNFYPNRYIDRTKYYKINELQNSNAEVQIIGKIIHLKTVEYGKNQKRLVATFTDETGKIDLVWFQGFKWIQENLKLNEPCVVFGKCALFGSTFSISHPDIESIDEHKQGLQSAMQPVYPSTEMLASRQVTNKVINKMMQQLFLEIGTKSFEETLPNYLIDEFQDTSVLQFQKAQTFDRCELSGAGALVRRQSFHNFLC